MLGNGELFGIYAAAFVVALVLGAFLHPDFEKNNRFNVYKYRKTWCTPGNWSYLVLAILHFFGMGYTLVGSVCHLAFWLQPTQYGIQIFCIVVGVVVYAVHLGVTYCGSAKPPRQTSSTRSLPSIPF